jgi:hypothetical protein
MANETNPGTLAVPGSPAGSGAADGPRQAVPASRPALTFRKKLLFSLICTLVAGAVMYACAVAFRTYRLYAQTKQGAGWKPEAHRYDPELGFAPIAGVRAEETRLLGPSIPMRFDHNGFRVPVGLDEDAPCPRPLVLALGCSYTYGAGCLAEETYPYLVGRRLNGSSINAGVCSYGLAQMSVQAARLIPKYKPDYVLVQYSPWLVDRARDGFAPTFFGKLPTPYFVERDGKTVLHPPVFEPVVFDTPVHDYLGTKKGLGDFLSFQFRVGLPLYLHDDWNMGVYWAKRRLGALPPPADWGKILQTVYGDIADLCARHQARMVIVVLGLDANPITVPRAFQGLSTEVVDAHSVLRAQLPSPDNDAYLREYGHWQGTPPTLIDSHPNPRAQAIFAEEVLKVIQKNE